MLRRAMAATRRSGLLLVARQPPTFGAALLAPRARTLCDAAEDEEKAAARKAELQEFLRAASRPVMGKAKARQSAGQRALDLTKQLKNLDDLDVRGLAKVDGAELKRRGVPVQERKRLLRFTDKYVQGFRHDGRTTKHSWKGWQAPYMQPEQPAYVSHTGQRPFNDHTERDADDADLGALELEFPTSDVLLRRWVVATRVGEQALAEALAAELAERGVEPATVRPSIDDAATPDVPAIFAAWQAAKEAGGSRDDATAALRDELRALDLGVEPTRVAQLAQRSQDGDDGLSPASARWASWVTGKS